MVRYFRNSKGSFYIIVAILCVANLMLGFELIKKITYKGTTQVMSQNKLKTDTKKIIKKTRAIKKEDFFLEMLASSNSYMQTFLNEEYRSQGIKKGVNAVFKNRLSFLNPKLYLTSQMPTMFSLVEDDNAKAVSSIINIKNINKNKIEQNNQIESKEEDYKGKEVESTKDLISSEKPNSIKLDDKDPYVMIYHTHATESYAPMKQNNYHVDKREHNVISVGEMIGGVLQEKGHKIKHIDKYHDLPSFNKSYNQSLKTAKEELGKNENLKIILDVHRDGVDEGSKYMEKAQAAARVNINGKTAATFKMVVGPDNPNKEQLLKFSRYIRDKSNEKYPGLCTGIIVKPYGKFNQYVSDHYTLLEIGSNLNTMDEAKETGRLVGDILNEVILDIKEDK